jgi:naphthoate synthase
MPKQLLQLFHIGQLRHTVYVVCDLNLWAERNHAIFKQTDADVTSFQTGYGSALFGKDVKLKTWDFSLEEITLAQEVYDMGMVNGDPSRIV